MLKPTARAFRLSGLGTMTLKGDVCVTAVSTALKQGYIHLDTRGAATATETEVGEGLRASGLEPRAGLRHHQGLPGQAWRRADFEKSFEESLQKLKLSSVDMLLIHWPNPNVPLGRHHEGAVQDPRRTAAAPRHIGIANFTVPLIEEAVKASPPSPWSPTRSRCIPFSTRGKVMAACRRHGLSVTAYCPLRARARVPGDPVLTRHRPGRTARAPRRRRCAT